MALIDALRMIAEPLRYLIDRVGRRVDCVERDIADVGNKVDFIHTTAPIVQTASVGQTVVVKAVDESGKPTEWEAKDVSSGGAAGGKQYIITQEMISLQDEQSESLHINFDFDELYNALVNIESKGVPEVYVRTLYTELHDAYGTKTEYKFYVGTDVAADIVERTDKEYQRVIILYYGWDADCYYIWEDGTVEYMG